MAKKYIDVEKLKESLKRRYTDITVPVITSEGGLESYYRRREIKDIIKLIDSLQQEQPEVDLEKEIKDTCREYRINESHEQELGKRDIENIAHYFYELGLNARKEE